MQDTKVLLDLHLEVQGMKDELLFVFLPILLYAQFGHFTVPEFVTIINRIIFTSH